MPRQIGVTSFLVMFANQRVYFSGEGSIYPDETIKPSRVLFVTRRSGSMYPNVLYNNIKRVTAEQVESALCGRSLDWIICDNIGYNQYVKVTELAGPVGAKVLAIDTGEGK